MAPASDSVPGGVPTGSCPSSRCFKASRWVPFTHCSCTLQLGVFALVFRSNESLCKSFKSRFSIPYSFLVFPGIFPIGFQTQMFWFSSLMQGVGIGVLNVMLKSLASQGKDLFLCDPSQLWLAVVLVLWLPLLSISLLSFYPLLWRFCSFSFQVPFWENYSIGKCIFVVSVGGGSFRIFLHHHLEPSKLSLTMEY